MKTIFKRKSMILEIKNNLLIIVFPIKITYFKVIL